MQKTRCSKRRLSAGTFTALFLVVGAAEAGPVTYTDYAMNPASGITYRRKESTINAGNDAAKLLPFVALKELYATPIKGHGQPGVALIDYDRDGDDDIYVTNGPGRANSLYQNRLVPDGVFTFVDVAAAAGVDATDMDGTGVCFGDIDNDGDEDLYVLGRMEPNRLFQNEGDGTFTEIGAAAGVDGGYRAHTSCTMGDINNDGLLDIFVANSFDWARYEPIFSDLYSFNEANDLYLNTGGNVFEDVSDTSGVRELFSVPPGDATITWGAALVDYDQDGDVDLMHADDQGAMPNSGFGGVDRGFTQTFQNDGSGSFVNVNAMSGSLAQPSAWMGFSYGDFNCDGLMDFFATSQGDYLNPHVGAPEPPGFESSRWKLQAPNGVFGDSMTLGFGVEGLGPMPFGWGTGTADYDNDGDTDIVLYGNLTVNMFLHASNPGVVLENQGCNASFTWAQAATASSAERTLRQDVEALALGDLNDDGFVDFVHASGAYVPETIPLVHEPQVFGGVFDQTAFFLPQYTPIGPFEWEWSGQPTETDGFLGVQISNAASTNGFVKIRLAGTKGLTTLGRANRDGIGAVVSFTPHQGKRVLYPVLGGSSTASQHSMVQGFGLGSATRGTLDILWPGGTHNRLYDVAQGERLTVPEIPCDYAAPWPNKTAYMKCVNGALDELVTNGTINGAMKQRLSKSAAKAFGH